MFLLNTYSILKKNILSLEKNDITLIKNIKKIIRYSGKSVKKNNREKFLFYNAA